MQLDSTTENAPLCACGCGKPVTWHPRKKRWNTYLHGHNMQHPDVEQRFWQHVDKSGQCWEWMAFRDRKGYGRFHFGSTGQNCLAHRFSWILHNGPIPDGLCVLHKCDNPRCVNPAHLFLGTIADNNADMMKKGRHATGYWTNPPHGEDAKNHILTEEDVRTIRRRYAAGECSFLALARQYGIAESAIRAAYHRRTWKHVA